MVKTIYKKNGITVKQIQTKEGLRWCIKSDQAKLTKDEVSELGSILVFRAVASGYLSSALADSGRVEE